MTWQSAMALLSAAGALIALWSLFVYRSSGGGAFGCAKYSASFWSQILYFRNESIEAVLYAAIFGLVLSPYVIPEFIGLTFLLLLSATGLLFLDALFTMLIETCVLKTWCPARIGTAAVNALLFSMVISFFV